MNDNELTFEEGMKRLEEIVAKLEKNEATLDESIKLFEEGTMLSAFCADKLKTAQQKIVELTKES